MQCQNMQCFLSIKKKYYYKFNEKIDFWQDQ